MCGVADLRAIHEQADVVVVGFGNAGIAAAITAHDAGARVIVLEKMPQAQAGGVTSLFGRTGAVTAQTADYSFAQISGTVQSAQLPSAGGDVSGALTSSTVSKLQNRPMSAMLPTSGQVLTWDGSQWIPLAAPSGGTSRGPHAFV